VQQAKLKACLEDWWLRFDDVKWGNFGRKEADAAVALLDRWAGPRLWSWKRWRFSIVTVLLLQALIALIALIAVALGLLPSLFSDLSVRNLFYLLGMEFLLLPIVVIAFALSWSVTRVVAIVVGRMCTGTPADAFLFLFLVVIHWLLFAYWSAVSNLIVFLPVYAFVLFSDEVSSTAFVSELYSLLREGLPHYVGGWFPIPLGLYHGRGLTGVKLDTDLIANGARIAFALVFLVSFVFRPLIQKPISLIWLRVVESDKPIFTMLFGAVGAVIQVAKVIL